MVKMKSMLVVVFLGRDDVNEVEHPAAWFAMAKAATDPG